MPRPARRPPRRARPRAPRLSGARPRCRRPVAPAAPAAAPSTRDSASPTGGRRLGLRHRLELAKWRRSRRRGEGGSADSRRGRRPRRASGPGAGAGRRLGAHTVAHARARTPPRPLPPEGPRGRGERCNLLATLRNCRRGHRRAPAPGPDGVRVPTLPLDSARRPRIAGLPAPAASGTRAPRKADRVPIVSPFAASSRPRPAAPGPQRSASRPSAGTAGCAGERGCYSPPPRAKLREVCHFARSDRIARKRGRGGPAALRARRPDTPSREPGGCEGGQRGSARTYSGRGPARAGRSPTPASPGGPVRRRRARAPGEKLQSRTHPPPRPAGPHPLPRVCEAAAAGGTACQVQPPPAPLPPSALTLEGSCTPNAKPQASWISLHFITIFKESSGWHS